MNLTRVKHADEFPLFNVNLDGVAVYYRGGRAWFVVYRGFLRWAKWFFPGRKLHQVLTNRNVSDRYCSIRIVNVCFGIEF